MEKGDHPLRPSLLLTSKVAFINQQVRIKGKKSTEVRGVVDMEAYCPHYKYYYPTLMQC
jgi:hypothetical protein